MDAEKSSEMGGRRAVEEVTLGRGVCPEAAALPDQRLEQLEAARSVSLHMSSTPLVLSLNPNVSVSILLGGSVGLMALFGASSESLLAVVELPGELWLKALKCIVLPMLVFSMLDSMVRMRSLPDARTVGFKTVGLYSLTTVVAAVEGCLVAAAIMGPPVHPPISNSSITTLAIPDMEKRTSLETILSIFSNMVPGHLVSDVVENRLLPVIIASIVFGLLVEREEEDGSQSLALKLVRQLNQVVVKVVTAIMTMTPLGVGTLILASVTQVNLEQLGRSMGLLILTVVVGLALHLCVVYPCLLCFLARRNPLQYGRNLLPAMATALGTASSSATLPMSTSCAVEGNGIAPLVANFVLGLGATINMDGTSIYLTNAVYFLGRLHGVHFSMGQLMTIAIMAMLCSIGTAPVPSASLVLLATILTAVGVPLNGISIIYAVDWMLDRLRTVVNICGDATVAAVMDRHLGGSREGETQ